MAALAAIRDRVELVLSDVANAIFTANLIDECIQQALDQYNFVNPLAKETVITLPGDSHEIALASLSGLVQVTDVWWPYDSDAADETWPPNRIRGWRMYWDDAQPVLVVDIDDGDQPQTDDEMRVWYTARHTIDGLSSGSATTLTGEHESLIVIGAAAHAAMARALDLVETAGTDLYAVGLLGTWGKSKLREFTAALKAIQQHSSRSGRSWGDGWRLDKWDS